LIKRVGEIAQNHFKTSEKMTGSVIQVSQSMETMAGIAEQNSAATQQMSASAYEINHQVEEIVSSTANFEMHR